MSLISERQQARAEAAIERMIAAPADDLVSGGDDEEPDLLLAARQHARWKVK